MASVLQTILGRKDVHFDIAIKDLEAATGNKGIDLQLIGEILAKAHRVIKKIGLSSDDLTAHELYNALRVNDDLLHNQPYTAFLVNDECVSFNQQDLRDDEDQVRNYSSRSVTNMRKCLIDELVKRYQSKVLHDGKSVEDAIKIITNQEEK